MSCTRVHCRRKQFQKFQQKRQSQRRRYPVLRINLSTKYVSRRKNLQQRQLVAQINARNLRGNCVESEISQMLHGAECSHARVASGKLIPMCAHSKLCVRFQNVKQVHVCSAENTCHILHFEHAIAIL